MWYDVLHSTHSREAWSWAKLRVSLSEYPDQKDLLAGSRLPVVVPEIWIDDGNKLMVEAVLESLSGRKSPVEKLTIELDSTIGTIEASLLAQAVTKVVKCVVTGGQPEQLEAILGAVSECPDFSLHTLGLSTVARWLQVNPDLLGKAAVKLTSLYLGSLPTSEQIGEILTRLADTEGNKLRTFGFYGPERDISNLPPETVAAALLKLENIGFLLHRVILSPGQLTHLMSQIRDTEDLGFTQLDLTVDLSQVAPDVLVGAVTRLEGVCLGDVTPPQLQDLFTRIQQGGSQLKNLILKDTDLSSITPEDLVGALKMLENVWFDDGVLTTAQVTAILAMLNEGSQGRLRSLQLYLEEERTEAEVIDLLEAAEPNDILEIGFFDT